MTDSITLITRIASTIGQFEILLHAVVFVIGLVFVVQALKIAIKRVEFGAQSASILTAITNFIIGIGLLAFPRTVGLFLGTLFGVSHPDDPAKVFAYSGDFFDPLDEAQPAIEAIVILIQFIGFIAIARGLLFLNAASTPSGPKSFGPGITFIVAGTLAVNFPTFFGALSELFIP